MKKIVFTALALMVSSAFAGGAVQQQQQQQQTSTNSVSAATSQNAGNNQTITVAPVTTNVASDLKDQGATAAAITSAAAIEIAKIQAGTAGDRDLNDDKNKELDRQTAKDIANINGETARAVAGTTQTIKNTPSIATAALVSSNDTCMGSVSVGGSGPGFSIGVGTTYTDGNCVMLKNSRELWNMGMKAASLALMCTDKANREALEITGFECPQTTAARKAEAAKTAAATQTGTAEVVASNYQGDDPIVRARLGQQ